MTMTRAQKTAAKQAERDWAQALDHAPTRRVLREIIDQCGVYTPAFTGNSTTFYNEGRRSVGLDIIATMERVREGAYLALQREALEVRMRQRTVETEEDEHDA